MDHIKRPSLSGLTSKRHSSPKGTSKDDMAKGKHKHAHVDSLLNGSHHLHSGRRSPSSTTATTTTTTTSPANTLSIAVESPPNIFFGTPAQSTGALFSGQLRVTVVEPEITLTAFTMQLLAVITARRPVVKDCLDCSKKTTELFKWTFITEPKTLAAGTHSFPFSYLLPGHLPTSTHGSLGDLEYLLDACATARPRASGKGPGEITLRQPLPLSRALMPAAEKNSLRVFPPTNLTAHVTMSPTIYPIGESTVLMKLSGVSEKQPDHQQRWRLRKMSWRLEETEKMVSPACSKHAAKVGGEGRGIAYEDVRPLGQMELKEGWKSNFDDGTIEMEFNFRPAGHIRPLCDVDSPTGLSVSHSLVIELVVAEEWVWTRRPGVATPSGAARILRAQFQVFVTERAGLGISWDEEQPPMYEDVPDSPPWYPQDTSATSTSQPPLNREPSPRGAAARAISASGSAAGAGGDMTPNNFNAGVNTSLRPPVARSGVTREYDGPPLYSPSVVPQAVPSMNLDDLANALPRDEEVEHMDLGESLRRPGPPPGYQG